MLSKSLVSFRGVLAFGVLCVSTAAFGQADNWLNPAGGNFDTDSNWSLGSPGAGNPTFNLGFAYTVDFTQSDTDEGLNVENDNVTFDLGGNTFQCTALTTGVTTSPPSDMTLSGGGTVLLTSSGLGAVPVAINNSGDLTINATSVTENATSESVTSTGPLTVENGGQLKQTNLQGGSMNLSGNLTVNDGTVHAIGALTLGTASITAGSTVSTLGAAGPSPSSIAISASGAVGIDASQLTAQNESVLFNTGSALTLTDNASVGAPDGDITLAGSTDIQSGQISSGITTTLGGSLLIQLNANMIGVDGAALTAPNLSLGGTLQVTLPGNLAPVSGDEYQLYYDSNTITGTFTNVSLPTLPSGESWNTSQLYTDGIISVVPEPASLGLLFAAGGLLLRRRRA